MKVYYDFLGIIKDRLTQNPQKTFDDNTNRLQVGKSMSIVTPWRRRKGGYSYKRPNHILPANNNVIPITTCPTETYVWAFLTLIIATFVYALCYFVGMLEFNHLHICVDVLNNYDYDLYQEIQ